MRKLLLFLLLLGAGLTLLYWLDRRTGTGERETPAPTVTRPEDQQVQGQRMVFGGGAKLSLYDEETKRALLTLESKESRTEGDVDHLTDVQLELFDRDAEGVVQTRVHAERARVKRLAAEDMLHPSWEWRLELEGVQAQLLAGMPLAPLSFQTATAVVDATDPNQRRVSTEEEFTARSPELTLDGRGLYCELDRGLIEIPHEGKVELRRESATPTTLAATGDGPLQVRREPGAGGAVTLEAWKGARLELPGENPGRLVAEHVALRAAPPAAGRTGELGLERIDADGGVDWNSGDSVFQGERATASFAPGGRLERARLEGLPRAELVLTKLSKGVLPDITTKQPRQVAVTGKDALDIVWKDDGFELVATGQSSVENPEFRLRSNNGLEGFLAEDRNSARFSAGGGVVVESGSTTLETQHFDVAIRIDENGETRLEGTASGGPRLVGKLPPQGPGQEALTFTLTSPDDLKIERSGLGWRVVESTHVEVSLDGPDGFRARADRVQDFDVARLAFLAEGGIVFDKPAGRLAGHYTGERLEVLSVDPVPHLVLTGTAEKKASYSGEYGEASALRVEQTGGSLHAVGAVTFDQTRTDKQERLQLTADELSFDRSEDPELLPGERVRTLRSIVTGNVQGNLQSAEQTLVLHCDRLSAETRVRVVAGVEKPIERGSLLIAEGDVRTDVLDKDSEVTIECDRLEAERTESDLASGFRHVVASGNVRFQGHKGLDLGGSGEVLVLDADRRGTLEAKPYERVTLNGHEPSRNLPFRLTAERVDFEVSERGEEHVHALRPELRMAGMRSRADDLLVDVQVGVELSGHVRSSGLIGNNEPFTLDADRIVVVGRRGDVGVEAAQEPTEAGIQTVDQFDSLLATGSVDFRLADSLRARGERLTARRLTGIVRLEGAPASFEMASARLETEWVEFDPVLQVLVGTGKGVIHSLAAPGEPQQAQPDWTLDFLSASTLLELDSLVLVIQEPVFRTAQLDMSLRASWAVLWLNREGLQDAAKRDELLKGLKDALERMGSLSKAKGGAKRSASLTEAMKVFRTQELAGLLREVYFEGPVEFVTEGELVARADAVYLDATQQHGWLARATVNMAGEFIGQRAERLIVKADWLRLSSDASLRADQATVTFCTFDDPHVKVVTGDMRITPVEGAGKEHYNLLLKDNRVELYHLLKIPLPTIDIATDEELAPLWSTLSLANSARFGTLLSFAVTRPADRVGALANSLVGKKDTDVDAHYKIDGSYLGSRGGLLDLGVEIEGKNEYWLDLFVGLALDNGEDRGFIRVPEDERGSLRRWIRSQGFFKKGKSAWSFSYTDQSDAGVQSEFYEGQFLRYERAENYVQWRRSDEEYFLQGSVKVRVDDFRSDVEELPSVGAYRGRAPLARLGSLSLLHTGDVRAEYLRRREGADPQSPFADPTTFPDGLGDREVMRLDTTQALELPVPVGAGWKLTPFVSAHATAWDEGVDPDDSPTRVITEGGARLGTTFWKRTESGKLHQVAPFVELRSELARTDSDGIPVAFDSLENQLSGDFLRLGSRTRFWRGEVDSLLDVDLVGTYARNRSDGVPDGWMPVEAFARLVLEPFGHEVEAFHDGRYDIENHQTVYSLVSLGTHLGEQWGIQASHQRGRDVNSDPLFEVASVSGLYRWTEKWEFEGRESFSLLEDTGLDSRFVLRRYGHDIVFEVETSVREGEGSSFGLSVKPRFGYHPPRVGYVPW